MRKIMFSLAGLLMAVGVLFTGMAQPAVAGSNDVYMGWRTKSNTVCVNYPASGGWYKQIYAAVNAWNRSDATVVRRDNCVASGFSKSQTVFFKSVSTTERFCATTQSIGPDFGASNSIASRTVTRIGSGSMVMSTVIGSGFLIEVNFHPTLYSGCRRTPAMVQHLLAHELGHALGLGHAAGGLMASGGWGYNLPTATNITQLNVIY